jgi:biopolymer transport protein ExbB/TolQ
MVIPVLADSGIIYAFGHAPIEGKCVLFILLMGSIFSWSVMWTKFALLRAARKQTNRFLKMFRKSKTPLALYQQKLEFDSSSIAAIYQAGCRELCLRMVGSSEVDETFMARIISSEKIGPSAMASVRSAMERCVGEELLRLESQLILLATAVSGAPFMGLLGTVWGVMDAFSGVAQAGQASLAAMAPGVSGSLITTVIALCVAIPAMFGYNYLVNALRQITIEMENFSAELACAFEHKYARMD